MAEDEEPELRALIWATTRHLKYAQYAPTNNNRKNKPGVTMSDRSCVTLCLKLRSLKPSMSGARWGSLS